MSPFDPFGSIADHADDLSQLFAIAWEQLQKAPREPAHPFRYPCIATINGEQPEQRTVVLRDCQADQRMLVCHTDVRSHKVDQLRRNPRLSWHFFDLTRLFQFTVHGVATGHQTDDFSHEQWDRIPPQVRRMYLAAEAPGVSTSTPSANGSDQLHPVELPPKDLELARSRFVAIRCITESADLMLVRPQGNRRARYHWQDDHWSSHWVTP